jgi:hypothetical protein
MANTLTIEKENLNGNSVKNGNPKVNPIERGRANGKNLIQRIKDNFFSGGLELGNGEDALTIPLDYRPYVFARLEKETGRKVRVYTIYEPINPGSSSRFCRKEDIIIY